MYMLKYEQMRNIGTKNRKFKILFAVIALAIIVSVPLGIWVLRDDSEKGTGEILRESLPPEGPITGEDFIVLELPEYAPDADDDAVLYGRFDHPWDDGQYIAVTTPNNPPKEHLDILWQEYLKLEQDKAGRYQLTMDIYKYNNSDQLQDYWDLEGQPIATYWLPAYVELELQTQTREGEKTIGLSVAIEDREDWRSDELEQLAADLATLYGHKFAGTVDKLTIFTFHLSEDINDYKNRVPIWLTFRGMTPPDFITNLDFAC